jgi:hypothetical protein
MAHGKSTRALLAHHFLSVFIKYINRKFHVATEIGNTFFGCWSVTGQPKK